MKIQDHLLNRLVNAICLLDMEKDEIWKEIDFLQEKTDSRYFISNYGSVISLCNNRPIILQPFLCGNIGNQYYYVSIGNNHYRINRLVAKAFIENAEPTIKTIVHHKDHNKLNNHYSNLEWVTPQENINAYRKYKLTKEQ